MDINLRDVLKTPNDRLYINTPLGKLYVVLAGDQEYYPGVFTGIEQAPLS